MSGMRPGSGSRPGSRSGTPLRAWSTASSSRPGSAGSLGTSDRGTVLLLRELVHAHVGKTEGGADARQSVNTLRYAIRVVGSKIGPPPSLSSTSAVSDAIVRRLAKSYRHEDATRASYLIEVLRSNDSLSNPQLLLQLLDALAESAHDDIYVALPGDAQKVYESYGDRVDSPREPKEALLDLAGSGIPRPPSSKPPQSGSNHSGRSIPSGIDTTESPVPPPAPSPELVAAVVQRENSAVPERALLRQALFVLHGIDGDLVKSDPTGNGHPSISSKIGRGRKGLLLRVCELGAILSRVREFSQSGSEQDETSSGGKGLVVGAFKAALSEELDKFFAEMAAVETQVKNDKAWSLRRLTSWLVPPHPLAFSAAHLQLICRYPLAYCPKGRTVLFPATADEQACIHLQEAQGVCTHERARQAVAKNGWGGWEDCSTSVQTVLPSNPENAEEVACGGSNRR
mmetsp:Transcript_5480/g.23261  ORF Transcript_5480/g.23261 Transcript_5480/m.23261 type:complete len:456 (-) Transcript_5480:1658-3025(-)